MTEEEKALIMQFVGQTYGQSHKNDQMIVGHSGNLAPQSEAVKQQFENIARTPTVQGQQVPPPPPPVQEAPPVSYEQAVKELQEAEPGPVRDQPVGPTPIATIEQDSNQLELNLKEPEKIDKLIRAIEDNGLLLKKIIILLEKNGKSTRKKTADKKPG